MTKQWSPADQAAVTGRSSAGHYCSLTHTRSRKTQKTINQQDFMKRIYTLLIMLLMLCAGAEATAITSPGEIDVNKCYTITTVSRGSLMVKTGATRLAGNKESGFATDFNASDAQFQFAFVNYLGKTYLYSVGAQKFISKSSDGTLIDAPNTTDAITVESTTVTIEGYPLGIRFYNNTASPVMCINLGGSGQIAINGYGATNGTFGEDGNAWAIEEASAFDPTEALSVIRNNPNIVNGWNINSTDLTTNFWSILEENVPTGISALGGTPYYRVQDITITETQITETRTLEVSFKYSSGHDRLNILGVDLLDGSDNIVAYDYHTGYTGTGMNANTYLLNYPTPGTYKLRYIINGSGTSSSVGNIYLKTLKFADSFANISQWYVIRVNSNQANYMYYDTDNATTGISFTSNSSNINNDKYLWGLVKTPSGVQIYNKAAGSTMAIDNATPSTMSTDGVSNYFNIASPAVLGTYSEGADAYFVVYHDAGNYLNYKSGNLQRYNQADAGCTFLAYEVEAPTTLTYELTDANGATYSGTYYGYAGLTDIPLSGCEGYSLSNKTWDGNTVSATITFPFLVSSNGVTNYAYISNFGNNKFYWYTQTADANKVYVKKDAIAMSDTYAKYQWAIIPSFSNGQFSFKIKSGYTNTYITSTSTIKDHSGTVSLTETGTSLTFISEGSKNRWCLPTTLNGNGSTKLELSINSSTETANQELGTWTNHDGTQVTVTTASDFGTLITNLNTACTNFGPYNSIIGSNLGQYSGENASTMQEAYLTATTAESFSAAQISELTTTLENPATKLTINQPSGKFVTFYSPGRTKYWGVAAKGMHPLVDAIADAGLYYITNDNKVISYKYGQYLANTAGAPLAAVGNSGYAFTFSQSDQLGLYYVNIGGYIVAWTDGYTNRLSPVTNNEDKARWRIDAIPSLPVTISSAGYATLYAPVALEIPAGVKAFAGTVDKAKSQLTMHRIEDVIPANTAVVLKLEDGTEAGTFNFNITTTESTVGENSLQGTTAAQTYADQFVLGIDTENSANIGFFKLTGSTVLPGFKAYLPSNVLSAEARSITMVWDDETTGISDASRLNDKSEMINDKQMFDLQGRRVSNPQRGLYIVNGHKIVIK
jgi:hypothetical protein